MRMHKPLAAIAAATLAAGAAVLVTGAASAAPPFTPPQSTHALFVETDATSGNQVLSYHRASDGTIDFSGAYSTFGDGGTAVGATADPLASQGGLELIDSGRELVATNAGSDTISVFAVDGTHLTFLEQVGTDGEFPDSVASSGDLVSVLNAGGTGSVAEFRVLGGFLAPQPIAVRSLGLDNTNPPDFHHGAGEVAYTPDGTHLIIATKLSTNAYDVFNVARDGTLSASPVVTTADNDLPFSFVFDAAGDVVATEAATSSVSTYAVNANGTLTSLGTVRDGEAALCWISGANGYFYGSNAGSGNVSLFDESATGAPQLVAAVAATAHAGTTDSVVSPDGRFFYVESGGAGTIDAYAIGTGGTLTQLETVFNIPVASEGIAIS